MSEDELPAGDRSETNNRQKDTLIEPKTMRDTESRINKIGKARNRLYGGVRGQVNTKRGEHLRLVFTSYSI